MATKCQHPSQPHQHLHKLCCHPIITGPMLLACFSAFGPFVPLLTPLDGPHPSIIHLYTFLPHRITYYSCKKQPGLLIFKILVPQYMPLLDSISARPILRVSGREHIRQFSLLVSGMFYVMSPGTGG